MTVTPFHIRSLVTVLSRLGRGGSSWQQQTASGDGVSSAVTVGSGATITGYTVRRGQVRGANAAARVPVSAQDWLFFLIDGDGTLASGATLVSAADSTFRLRMLGPAEDNWPGFTVYRMERI